MTESLLSQIEDKNARAFIQELTLTDPNKRLGSTGGFTDIMKHSYFSTIDLKETKEFMGSKEVESKWMKYISSNGINSYEEDLCNNICDYSHLMITISRCYWIIQKSRETQ
jgi:hypothetical protein